MNLFCPICLNDIGNSIDEDGNDTKSSREEFHLQKCGHIFCKDCLSEYCTSKINTGIVNIKCCFDVHESLNSSRFCEVPFEEKDIRFLLRNHHGETSVDKTNIIKRYERFKFDLDHKDSSRRCPSCDHPHIFNMKPASIPNAYTQKKKDKSEDVFSASLFLNFERSSSLWTHFQYGADHDASESVSDAIDMISVQKFKSSIGNSLVSNLSPARNLSENHSKVEGHLQTEAIEPENPMTTCVNCSTEFCFYHSNSHPNETCDEYIKRSENVNKLTFDYLKEFTKECPECHAKVQKIGGCNQIKCASCNTHFCWICLAIVDDNNFPSHFQWWNVNGCPNMQLHEGMKPSKLLLYSCKFLALIQVIVIGIPASLLTLITYMICGMCRCFCISRESGSTELDRALEMISFWGNTLGCIIITPFVIISCFVSGVVLIITNFFKFCRRQYVRRNGKLRTLPKSDQSKSIRSNSQISKQKSIDTGTQNNDMDKIMKEMEEGVRN